MTPPSARSHSRPFDFVRARLPADGSPAITRLSSIWALAKRVAGSDEYLLESTEHDLLSVDARTGQTTVLRTEISTFSVSDDGRFVVWARDRYPLQDPFLWDRLTDEERPLGLPEWSGTWITASIEGDAVLAVANDTAELNDVDAATTQLILLSTGEELVVDGSWINAVRIGDTHVLQRRLPEYRSSLAILEPGSQTPRSIPHGTLQDWWVQDQSLWTLGIMDDAEPSHLDLLELAAPDFVPRTVADTWHPMRLADGRLLTLLDRDADDRHGTLALVDVDGKRTDLDHDVLSTHNTLAPLVDDVVVYAVRDPAHERSGVWIAQIAPLPEP